MINKQTCVILGAGASIHAGYPTGRQLFDELCENLQDNRSQHNGLLDMGFRRANIIIFREALFHSGQTSVDAFLEHRPDLLEIGKAAIAHNLIQHEYIPNLFVENPTHGNWYKLLFQSMNTEFEKFGRNRISFITFNYDRSLEQFLFLSLKNAFNKLDDAIESQLRGIPILHVHGRLGGLPWQGDAASRREYRTNNTPEDIACSSAEIKIVHEGEDLHGEFSQASSYLSSAEVVLFLGFGYFEKTMGRLGLDGIGIKKTIQGSGGCPEHS